MAGSLRRLNVFLAMLLSVLCSSTAADNCTLCRHDENWELVAEVTFGSFPVYKYRSKRTGLTVVLARTGSSIVKGHFCLATKAMSNDGLPHVLEHLVFLGSKDHPYRETLNLLGSRCLASSVDAFTHQDHTCYHVSAIGSSGFLTIAPVLLDHILFPLLRAEDAETEVHHVTEGGTDAGIVYSEMKSKEDDPFLLLNIELMKLLYPGNNSYHYEVGGRTCNLRDDNIIEKVRNYHKRYYVPENLHLIVTGQVSAKELFEALEETEAKILLSARTSPSSFERPFLKDLEPLEDSVEKQTYFPSGEEMFGQVEIGWRIPFKLNTEEGLEVLSGLILLSNFLSTSPVAPFSRRFVLPRHPLANTAGLMVKFNWQPVLVAFFEEVPVEKVEEVQEAFEEVTKAFMRFGFSQDDMEQIRSIANWFSMDRKRGIENDADSEVLGAAIMDMLYSEKPEHFGLFFEQGSPSSMEKLAYKSEEYWIGLMRSTFSLPKAVLLGYPSSDLRKNLVQSEEERIRQRIKLLGAEGLAEAKEKVLEALGSQRLPPNSVLESVPLPNVKSIVYDRHQQFNYTTEQPEGFKLRSIPFRFQLDDVDSGIVKIGIFLDLFRVRSEERPFIPLLKVLWLKSPLKKADGSIWDLADVVQHRSTVLGLIRFTLGDGAYGEFKPGNNAQLMGLQVETDMDNYLEAMDHIKGTLMNATFLPQQIGAAATELLIKIVRLKHSETLLVQEILDRSYFSHDTLVDSFGAAKQKRFLEGVLQELSTNPVRIIQKLRRIQKILLQPPSIVAFMSANLDQLVRKYGDKADKPWTNFFGRNYALNVPNLRRRFETKSEHSYRNPRPSVRHVIQSLATMKSCILLQGVNYNVTDWEDVGIAPMRLMLGYITDVMFWEVRRLGLAYHATLHLSVYEGRVIFRLSKVSGLVPAYRVVRSMWKTIVDETFDWDGVRLESARGGLIYKFVKNEALNPTKSSIAAYFRRAKDHNYTQRFVEHLSNVTLDQVKALALHHLPKFLDPDQVETSIVCEKGEVEKVMDGFEDIGISLRRIHDVEELTDSLGKRKKE